MANRLTKIYTRTGDDGTTGMANGSRLAKDDLLVQAIGEVDELNSLLAVVHSSVSGDELPVFIFTIQNDLFNAGGELSLRQAMLKAENVNWLEQSLDTLNTSLPPLKEFILPGGGLAASHCHVARAVCRRVERTLVALNREQALNKNLLAYFNRLSDFLFVLARTISKQEGMAETYWQSEKLKK